MRSRAVFLDRDGVINRTVHHRGKERAPERLEDFEYLPGVPEAVARLRGAGFLAVVVTNQPDVARGWQRREVVEAMNRKVVGDLRVDALEVCWHVDEDGCGCRKPRPGMLLKAARELGIDLARSYMVGDRYGDVRAGISAGCSSILIGPGAPGEEAVEPVGTFPSLSEAVDWILALT